MVCRSQFCSLSICKHHVNPLNRTCSHRAMPLPAISTAIEQGIALVDGFEIYHLGYSSLTVQSQHSLQLPMQSAGG